MFGIYQNMFNTAIKKIAKDADVIFVADYFVEHYTGGAELTLQALIDSIPFEIKLDKIQSKDLTAQTVEDNIDKFWIFGNFSEIKDFNVYQTLMNKARYAVIECDYKFCKYRSIEKHRAAEGHDCDCANTKIGHLVANFITKSAAVFWMSEAQKSVYDQRFLNLSQKNESYVLSSVFDSKTLAFLKSARITTKNDKWIVLGSPSWVKGFDQAKKYCDDNKLNYEIVWNLPYEEMLKKLAATQGLVYLPAGADTCPRLVTEARLLGCELILNENVQHIAEEWF